MKKCKFCWEQIKTEAIKCRFCWKFLDQDIDIKENDSIKKEENNLKKKDIKNEEKKSASIEIIVWLYIIFISLSLIWTYLPNIYWFLLSFSFLIAIWIHPEKEYNFSISGLIKMVKNYKKWKLYFIRIFLSVLLIPLATYLWYSSYSDNQLKIEAKNAEIQLKIEIENTPKPNIEIISSLWTQSWTWYVLQFLTSDADNIYINWKNTKHSTGATNEYKTYFELKELKTKITILAKNKHKEERSTLIITRQKTKIEIENEELEKKKAEEEKLRIEKEKIEKDRAKILAFKNLKQNLSIEFWDEKYSFSNISINKRYIHDRYSNRWFYNDAERWKTFISSKLNITSKNKNPKLSPVYLYKYTDWELKFYSRFYYNFYKWKDYWTYLWNYSDYWNDFSHTETIWFSIGATIEKDKIYNEPIFMVINNSKCLLRTYEQFERPEISYKNSNCNIKRNLYIDDFKNWSYKLVKIFNKNKIK